MPLLDIYYFSYNGPKGNKNRKVKNKSEPD